MTVCIFRILPGQLCSAVISATVRDSSKAENIPVAVKYSLSTSPEVRPRGVIFIHVYVELLCTLLQICRK